MISFRDNGGKWRNKKHSTHKTKREAQAALTAARRAAARQEFAEEAVAIERNVEIAVDDVMRHYLESLRGRPSAGVAKYHVEKILADWSGVKLRDVRKPQLQKWLYEKLDSGLSPSTVNDLRKRWCAAIQRAISDELTDISNVGMRSQMIPMPPRRPELLSADEIKRLMAAASECDFELPLALLLFQGLRTGELYALEWRDISKESMLIHISKSHDRNLTKSGRDRSVPIMPETMDLLMTSVDESSGLVFPSVHGTQRPRNQKLGQRLNKCLDDAGIDKKIRVHDLRHILSLIHI